MGSFKKLSLLLLVVLSFSFAGCEAESAPDLLLSYRFRGTDDLSKQTNFAKLRQVFALTNSITFRDRILEKLSETPEAYITGKVTTNSESLKLVRPLLDSLLRAESFLEVRRGSSGGTEVLFAVKPAQKDVGLWDTNLQRTFELFAKGKAQKGMWEKFNSWEIKRTNSADSVRVVHAGDWFVVGIGGKELPLQNNLLRRIANGSAPVDWNGKTNWLEATVDLPRLQNWVWLSSLPFKPAKVDISLSNPDENIRTVLRATYPEPLQWKAAPWQVPANLIMDPLVAFSASQNLSVLLNQSTIPGPIAALLPNQFYSWAHPHWPLMIYGASGVKDVNKAFEDLKKQIPALNQKLENEERGKLVLATNSSSIQWTGSQMATPQIAPTNTSMGNYLLFSMFPLPPSKDPMPAGLLQQFATRTNLIYYGWELTQHRVGPWNMISKALPFFGPHLPPVPLTVVKAAKTNEVLRSQLADRILHQRWQGDAAPLLGNTTTEVTLIAPNEIQLSRKSHLGFTAFELMYITHWLNQPGFPLFRDNPQAKSAK